MGKGSKHAYEGNGTHSQHNCDKSIQYSFFIIYPICTYKLNLLTLLEWKLHVCFCANLDIHSDKDHHARLIAIAQEYPEGIRVLHKHKHLTQVRTSFFHSYIYKSLKA
jgi:hypothetical protein